MDIIFPKISIVTASFNQAEFLEYTIRSVINQGYPNIEYIIIDGGSTDSSWEIIEKYSDRLAYWQSAPDNGQASAIFQGFEKSTGEILAWINSDDFYCPGRSFLSPNSSFGILEHGGLLGMGFMRPRGKNAFLSEQVSPDYIQDDVRFL